MVGLRPQNYKKITICAVEMTLIPSASPGVLRTTRLFRGDRFAVILLFNRTARKLSKLRIMVVPCTFFYNFLCQFFYNFERSDHYQTMTE